MFKQSLETQQFVKRLGEVQANETITYEQLNAVVKGDVQGKQRPALYSALRILQRDGIAFATVRNVGFKRIISGDVVDAAKAPMQRIRSSCRRAAKILNCAEYDKLPRDKQNEFLALSSCYGAIEQATRPAKMDLLKECVDKTQRKMDFTETLALFMK